MHTRVPGRTQMWIRRTPTPEPLPPNSSIVNYLPGDESKPSLVILALTQFSYGRFKATLHKLRREVRLIFATNEADLGHAVREESNNGTLAGIIIADAEIMRRARRRLANAVSSLMHDPENEWTVIFAFDFARQAWHDSSRFTRFMRRHFPTLRWEIDQMMAVKEQMVLRRRMLRKMGARVYRRKYFMRGVVFMRVKQADRVVVVEREDGTVDFVIPNRTISSTTREEPDTPSTWRASGEEVFDCQMGVVDDFEEDEVHGVVDGNVEGDARPQPRHSWDWDGVDYNKNLSSPTYTDGSSMPCSSSNSSSSSEQMFGDEIARSDNDNDSGEDDSVDDNESVYEDDDIDDNENDIDTENKSGIGIDEDVISIKDEPAHSDNEIDTENENGIHIKNDYDIDTDKDAISIKVESAHSENGIDPDENDNDNQKDDWVPSDDERKLENPRRRCAIALHEFKNWRYNEETGKDEMLCSYFGIVGHAEDNRSLASIILGMCSVTPSR